MKLILLDKILAYLLTKEGCLSETADVKNEAPKVVIRDAFGYRYEIQVRLLGRTHEDRNLDVFKVNQLDFSEVIFKNG
jgi:hypothetical protein